RSRTSTIAPPKKPSPARSRASRRPPRSPRRRTAPTTRSLPVERENPQVGGNPVKTAVRARFGGGSKNWVSDGLARIAALRIAIEDRRSLAEGGDLVLGDRAGMERGRDERAGGVEILDRGEVGCSANAAAREHRTSPSRHVEDGAELFEVGPIAGADAGEVDGDETVRPQLGIAEQRLRPAPPLGTAVEREDDAVAEGGVDLAPVVDRFEALAADDKRRAERQPEGAIGDIGEAGVDPERDVGQRIGQPAQELEMIADAFDGIEVGDIEGWRTGDIEKPAGDGRGIVGRAERAHDRGVVGAPSSDGVDGEAALEVENRDDGE